MGEIVKKDKPTVETSFNRNNQHDLTKIIKGLKDLSPKMLARLEKIIESTDDKLALAACEAAMKALLQAAEMRDRDEITRKIAAVKLQGVRPQEGGNSNMPLVQFDVIQEV